MTAMLGSVVVMTALLEYRNLLQLYISKASILFTEVVAMPLQPCIDRDEIIRIITIQTCIYYYYAVLANQSNLSPH